MLSVSILAQSQRRELTVYVQVYRGKLFEGAESSRFEMERWEPSLSEIRLDG